MKLALKKKDLFYLFLLILFFLAHFSQNLPDYPVWWNLGRFFFSVGIYIYNYYYK